MSLKVYIGGKLYDKAEAKISVFDHGLLYGDGVFEGIRAYSGRVFRLKDARRPALRLGPSPSTCRFPLTQAAMAEAVSETPRGQQADRRLHPAGRHPGRRQPGARPPQDHRPPGHHHHRRDQPLPRRAVRARPEDRHRRRRSASHPTPLNPRVKSLNYLNNILAKIEGPNAGCLEALMLNHKGDVAECTGDNIFIVRSGEIHTPSIDSGILEGITRDAVIELAREAGITVVERTMDRHDIYTADECFLTGTAAEVIPVVECDGRPLGTGRRARSPATCSSGSTTLVRGEAFVILDVEDACG